MNDASCTDFELAALRQIRSPDFDSFTNLPLAIEHPVEFQFLLSKKKLPLRHFAAAPPWQLPSCWAIFWDEYFLRNSNGFYFSALSYGKASRGSNGASYQRCWKRYGFKTLYCHG